jgi:excisionase family DNA binding protein
MTVMDTTILTLAEVAERLRAKVYFVRTQIASGELKYIKIGKEFRVTDTALQDWIERSQRYGGDDDEPENREKLGKPHRR